MGSIVSEGGVVVVFVGMGVGDDGKISAGIERTPRTVAFRIFALDLDIFRARMAIYEVVCEVEVGEEESDVGEGVFEEVTRLVVFVRGFERSAGSTEEEGCSICCSGLSIALPAMAPDEIDRDNRGVLVT